MDKSKPNFVNLRVYQLAEKLADHVWQVVVRWEHFERQTIGMQLVRAADSVGANIAEGSGRGTYNDNRRLVRVARGSLNETRHWLRRAHTRNLLNKDEIDSIQSLINELAPRLNAYLNSIGSIAVSKPPDSNTTGN